MTVPAYVNTAHFRAHYKNAYFAGYGEEPPAPPPPGPPGSLSPEQLGVLNKMVEQKGGLYYWKPDAAASVMNMLGSMRTIFIGGKQELVEVVPYTAEEQAAIAKGGEAASYLQQMSAYNWMKTKLSEDKIVLAPVWITSNVPERSLIAVKSDDSATLQQVGSTPLYAILAEPGLLDRFPGGKIGMAIAGAAVVGTVALIYYGTKKRGRPSYRMS